MTILYQFLMALSFWAALCGLVILAAVACAAVAFHVFAPMGGDDA